MSELKPSLRRSRAALLLGGGDQGPSGQGRAECARLIRDRNLDLVLLLEGDGPRPMLLAAHGGRFDVLVVPAVEVLGGSVGDRLGVVSKLDQLGVKIVSARPEESWTGLTPEVRALLGWLQDQDRAAKSTRSRDALKKASSRGKKVGRPRKPVPEAALDALGKGEPLARVAASHRISRTSLRRAYAARLPMPVLAAQAPVPAASDIAQALRAATEAA